MLRIAGFRFRASFAGGDILTGRVSGEAYSVDAGLKVDVGGLLNVGSLLGLNGSVATIEFGPFPHVTLPPSGGFDSETVAALNLLDIVNSSTLSNSTAGGVGSKKAGSATVSVVENLNVLGLIKADLLGSYCSSFADNENAGSEASSSLVGLKILGKAISVTTPPNTRIDLLVKSGGLLSSLVKVGSVIINEQITTGDNLKSSSITNNALHVYITNPKILSLLIGKVVSGDIVVSSAHCDVEVNRQDDNGGGDDGDPPADTDHFATGSGRLDSPTEFATFNFTARDGEGQFEYNDYGIDLNAHSDSVTSFEVLDANCARFSGPAIINGQSGYSYTIEACDYSDPGSGIDSFTIDLSNGYHNSGILTDGNIQLN